MNNSIQFYEQGDGNSKGYLAESPTDSAVNKDRRVKQPDNKPRKTFRLNQGFFTKLMILSLAIGRCVSAKIIDGLMLKNEIKQ